jgi:hypothetical protein
MLTGLPWRPPLDEIGLPAQEGRRLQHIDDRATSSSGVSSWTSVSTGTPSWRAPLQHAQALLDARTAEALQRGTVGLVVRGLEDEGNAERRGDLDQLAGHVQRQRSLR